MNDKLLIETLQMMARKIARLEKKVAKLENKTERE